MALIAMCCYDTDANDRSKFTQATLLSLQHFVDWSQHRLFIIDNASCQKTKNLIGECMIPNKTVLTNEENLGTAEAINLAWKHRKEGEHAIKMDNDMAINVWDWPSLLAEAANRDPKLGQVGIKRKDCWENPNHQDPFYRSTPILLSHKEGETWILAEKVNHVMGSAVLHTSNLLDKIGYMKQPGKYGFDDSLMSARSRIAGFYNIFLSNIPAEHIDKGENMYQKEKEKLANEDFPEYRRLLQGYSDGSIPLYYNPFQ